MSNVKVMDMNILTSKNNIFILTLDIVQMVWGYIYIDFDKIFSKMIFKKVNVCKLENYDRFYLGSHIKNNCVLGRKLYFYKRRPESICKNNFEILPLVSVEKCQCTIEDFKWFVLNIKVRKDIFTAMDYVLRI